MTPNKFKALKIGDMVTLTEDQVPYYSGYAGNPSVIIPKGTQGVVGSVGVPTVYHKRGCGELFACVDFIVPDKFHGNPIHGHNEWRCSCYSKDVALVKTKI